MDANCRGGKIGHFLPLDWTKNKCWGGVHKKIYNNQYLSMNDNHINKLHNY